MVRLYETKDETIHGNLVIEEQSSGSKVEVYYVPPPVTLAELDIEPEDAEEYKIKIIEFDTSSGWFSMFPINTTGPKQNFLKSKYDKVQKITLAYGKPAVSRANEYSDLSKDYTWTLTFGKTRPLEEPIEAEDIADSPSSTDQILMILESLPPAFTKDYDYGLGLAKPYRFIVDAVEELTDCTEIIIARNGETEVEDNRHIFRIATDDFETIRKLLNSTTRMGQIAGRTVKSTEAYNFFAKILGRPLIPIKMGRHQLRRFLTKALQNDDSNLSEEGQEEIFGVIARNMKSISESRPERLVRLQNDIELVNLQTLIDRFMIMLKSGHDESTWQVFFDENPFILSQAFGYPIIKVGQKASIGGRKLSGKGEKITDFIVKNSMTNNTALVEIKTPAARLRNKREFRGGVFAPSETLAGSMMQALDQKYHFEQGISGIKNNSRVYDIESYSVHCCLIIRMTPEGQDEQKSFELFRRNSKDVEVVTFDELLEKLVQLRQFLESLNEDGKEVTPVKDVPF